MGRMVANSTNSLTLHRHQVSCRCLKSNAHKLGLSNPFLGAKLLGYFLSILSSSQASHSPILFGCLSVSLQCLRL